MLQFLTIVLDNFCNCNGLEVASADDLLYDGDDEFYQDSIEKYGWVTKHFDKVYA